MLFSSIVEKLWEFAVFWQQELLFFSAFFFLLGAVDDAVVDIIWVARWIKRRFTIYREKPPLRSINLPPPQHGGVMVIFIPVWQEADVIGSMLARTRMRWSEGRTQYRIYVGCYPNDPKCITEVIRAARFDPAIRLILCDGPGPTTKADCLNRLWRALLSDELKEGMKAKAIILHDAEDSVHSDALRIFDYLIEKASAVQLPVIPIRVPGSPWISGHYCDEFAEAHAKTLVVREAIGAGMPLAGVGCAIERNRLGRIALEKGGDPFDPASLTEDYELGLAIGGQGGRVILPRLLDQNGQLVGTRACFPNRLDASVRQKARWMTGIALAGWDRLGWSGGPAEYWMRLRDRKTVLAAIILLAAYVCIALTAALLLAEASGFAKIPPLQQSILFLLSANLVMLVWRMLVRAAFVWSEQDWHEALLSVPRALLANIVAIMAARRASWNYVQHLCGKKLSWDKTNHVHFPADINHHG